MKLSVSEAFIIASACGAVIFFCRLFPFLFFAGNSKPLSGRTNAFMEFIERIVPPVAMTVLTFNALGPSLGNLAKAALNALSSAVNALSASMPNRTTPNESMPALAVLCAAVLTALLHIWKRNPLISIFGGTALYMILQKIWL
jgi:branched-subunit amino acid transport protein AzlD